MSLVNSSESGQAVNEPSASQAPQKRSGNKSGVATIVIASLVVVALAGAGVWYFLFRGGSDQDERAAYEKIVRYQNENQLDSLADALEAYFDAYTADASHYAQLKDVRDKFFTERADWQAAQGLKSVDAVRQFLDIHPDGIYLKQARHMMDSLSYVAATEADTREAYEQYLDQFPDGAYLKQVREMMEDLDDVELTVEEKTSVLETVSTHFDALAENNREGVAATLAETINSYIGKSDPEMEDIYAYMQHMHSKSRTIVFLVKNPLVTKLDAGGRIVYNVQFTLDEETYTRSAHHAKAATDAAEGAEDAPKPEEVKHLSGVAVLNSNMRIVSLVLRQD